MDRRPRWPSNDHYARGPVSRVHAQFLGYSSLGEGLQEEDGGEVFALYGAEGGDR